MMLPVGYGGEDARFSAWPQHWEGMDVMWLLVMLTSDISAQPIVESLRSVYEIHYFASCIINRCIRLDV
ncbi:MAG: hypothetical protein NPIRA04_08470 [Nitrospirales bacterium]|nr:MAG: hypothetical protein NPIRA04_08470 [Nitrospirales bacterium]